MYTHRRGTQALSTPTALQDRPHNSTTPSPHLPRPLFTPRPSPSQHLPPLSPRISGTTRCFISCAVSTGAAVMRDNINILLTRCLSWSRQFAAPGIPQVGRNTSHQDTPVLQIHGWKLLGLNLNSVTSAGRVFAERGVFDFWWELLLSKTELIQCCCYTAIACKLAPRKMLEFCAGQLLSCSARFRICAFSANSDIVKIWNQCRHFLLSIFLLVISYSKLLSSKMTWNFPTFFFLDKNIFPHSSRRQKILLCVFICGFETK